jgi:hypothetical protein
MVVVIPDVIMMSFKWKCFPGMSEPVDYREETTPNANEAWHKSCKALVLL